jgi:hypothetical protein
MNLRQSKKLLILVSAILAWTLLGGFAETEKEEIRLDPISAADIYETDDSVILPMDALRVTEKSTPEDISHTMEVIEKSRRGELKKREPLTVIEYGAGKYSIIDGNRTYSALKEMGAKNVPAEVVMQPYHKDVITFDDLIAMHSEVESEFHQLMISLARAYQAELGEYSELYNDGVIHQKAKEAYDGEYDKIVDVFSADLTVPEEDLKKTALDLKKKYYTLCMYDLEDGDGYMAYIRLSNGTVAEIRLNAAE